MRKALLLILFSLGSLALFLILQGFFPKFQSILSFLFVLLLLGLYLWASIRRSLTSSRPLFRYSLAVIYWLPLLTLTLLVIIGSFYPFLKWNIYIRTQLLSFITITFFSQTIPVFFLILADAERLSWGFARWFAGKRPFFANPRRRGLLVTGWIAGALVWILLVLGTVLWVFDFKVKRVEVAVAGVPDSFKNFRIVQISDIHLGSWTSKPDLERAITMVNSLNPDVIFFTGDMFNYATVDGSEFQPILQKLHAKFGIYSILGNHDYGDYVTWPNEDARKDNMVQLVEWYRKLGWILLRNESATIRKGNDSIAVIGVENWGAEKRYQKRANMRKALLGITGVPCKILLSHDPTYWASIVSKEHKEICLTLSGHTHGGQVGIDTKTFHWSPIAWLQEYWGGLYIKKAPADMSPQYLYVNCGLGTIGYSGRIGIKPEITLLILK